MARIRTVKPEMPQDAKLARVSREARYHFVLLLTVADDEGFFRANPRGLLGQLYPHDPDVSEQEVERLNAALAGIGLMEFCDTPDGALGRVRNWKKHQRIDRPSKSHLGVAFAQYSRDPREGVATGVLSPESLVQSLDHDADDTEVAAALGVREPELTAMYLCISANNAVTERWGESTKPYTQGSAAALYSALQESGVPADIARRSIYRQCRESPAIQPPGHINYFRKGILADWDAEQVKVAAAATPIRPPSLEETQRSPPRKGGGVAARTFANGVAALSSLPD